MSTNEVPMKAPDPMASDIPMALYTGGLVAPCGVEPAAPVSLRAYSSCAAVRTGTTCSMASRRRLLLEYVSGDVGRQ